MELETGLHGVTRPKPDLEPEQDPERLKSGHEPKLSESDLSDEDQFSSDSDSEEDPKISVSIYLINFVFNFAFSFNFILILILDSRQCSLTMISPLLRHSFQRLIGNAALDLSLPLK
jgi:hypothetical protein